jgi:hypothetical protein
MGESDDKALRGDGKQHLTLLEYYINRDLSRRMRASKLEYKKSIWLFVCVRSIRIFFWKLLLRAVKALYFILAWD